MTRAGSHEPSEADVVPASNAAGGKAVALRLPAGPPGHRGPRTRSGLEAAVTASALSPRFRASRDAAPTRLRPVLVAMAAALAVRPSVCCVRGRDCRFLPAKLLGFASAARGWGRCPNPSRTDSVTRQRHHAGPSTVTSILTAAPDEGLGRIRTLKISPRSAWH